MRKVDFTFNSEKENGTHYQLASGYISETVILFEKENVICLIDAKGTVEFYDDSDCSLASANLPKIESGKGVYQDITCFADTNSIKLQFPIYKWIDNYPNCDGEHDRWDTVIIGQNTIEFNLANKTITL